MSEPSRSISEDERVELVIGEELQKERAAPGEFAQLMRFYSVSTLEDLVRIQSQHIERLQAKLPPLRDERPGYTPREG